jgi:hypothetical protein
MSVRHDTQPGRAWLVRGMIGLVAALGLAGCASASTAAPGTETAKTLPAASAPATASAPAASVPATSAPATATGLPSADAGIEVYGNCKTPSVEPTEIVLACADYKTLLEALHWTSWTATSATAVGTLVYSDCTPNCAEGHFHNVPGTRVTLTVPARTASGQRVWSEIQESPEPPGYATGPYHGGPQPLPKAPI